MSKGSFALVTGATRGIGMAFARELAARGQNLVLVARSREHLETLANELRRANSVTALVAQVDLSRSGGPQALAALLACWGIPVSLLVNNAGFGWDGEVHDLSLSRQLEMLRLNNEAIVELTYSVLPLLLEHPQKGIINISATAGVQPVPFASIDAATKSFITTFSMALEQELRAAGVTVVTVCPGRIRKSQNGELERPASEKWAGIYQTPKGFVEEALRVLS